MADILYHAVSVPGRRSNNEDSFAPADTGAQYNPAFPGLHLFAVADGMGGAAGGEVASGLAIGTLFNYFKRNLSVDEVHPITELRELLADGFIEAQRIIADEIAKDSGLTGMGCTLTALLISDNKYVWSNIGDSRLYLVTGTDAKLLTKDHTLLQEYTEKSDTPPDAGWIKNYSHYLTKAIDGGDGLPDIFPTEKVWEDLPSEYCFVLCSDGLVIDKASNYLQTLTRIIRNSSGIKQAAEQMVANAYYDGSSDNITAALISSPNFQFGPSSDDNRRLLPFPMIDQQAKPGNKQKKKYIHLILVTIITLCAIISGIIVFSNEVTPSGPFQGKGEYAPQTIGTQSYSDSDPPGNLETKSPWLPFEDYSDNYSIGMDTLLNKDSKIFFNSYIGREKVLNYRISLITGPDTVGSCLQAPAHFGNSNIIELRKLGRISKGSNTLSIEALFENGSSLSGGDTYKFNFK